MIFFEERVALRIFIPALHVALERDEENSCSIFFPSTLF